MDQDAELAKFKFIAFSFVLFVVAAFQSCEALRYAVSATRATAMVRDIREERGRRGRHIGYRITYGFRKDGKAVTGYTIVGTDEAAEYAKGQEIEIDYLPGDTFSSRIAGTGSLFWPAVLALGIMALVASVVALWREAGRKVAGMRKR